MNRWVRRGLGSAWWGLSMGVGWSVTHHWGWDSLMYAAVAGGMWFAASPLTERVERHYSARRATRKGG